MLTLRLQESIAADTVLQNLWYSFIHSVASCLLERFQHRCHLCIATDKCVVQASICLPEIKEVEAAVWPCERGAFPRVLSVCDLVVAARHRLTVLVGSLAQFEIV